MPVPDFQSIMLPFLEALRDGKEIRVRDLIGQLAKRFDLTDEDLRQMLPCGEQGLFTNRVAWAKTHLKYAGLIENQTRGNVRIAEAGKKVLSEKPANLNCRYLKKFPIYLKFIGQIPENEIPQSNQTVSIPETNQTPQELLDTSFNVLRRATLEELLKRLNNCSPAHFEKVVVRLLLALGYGGVAGDGSVTGKSGDGGIDGIIKEDKLGLDIVCLQAKRWESKVGRPIIQGFVGSMDFIRAKKGVIITTSQFTQEALDFVERIEGKKVVLIDGTNLADLMIEYNVGVAVTKKYEIKEVSNDFFDEENS